MAESKFNLYWQIYREKIITEEYLKTLEAQYANLLRKEQDLQAISKYESRHQHKRRKISKSGDQDNKILLDYKIRKIDQEIQRETEDVQELELKYGHLLRKQQMKKEFGRNETIQTGKHPRSNYNYQQNYNHRK